MQGIRKGKIMKKRVLATLFAASLLVCACGKADGGPLNSKKDKEDEEIIETDDADESVEVEEVEIVGEEDSIAAIEEVKLPYVEENGIITSTDTYFSAPFAACFSQDGQAIEIPGMSMGDKTSYFYINDVRTAPADKEGYTVYTIETTASYVLDFYQDTTQYSGSFYFNSTFSGFSLADYYTGVVFPDQRTDGKEHMGFDNEVTVSWEDSDYTISYGKNREDDKFWDDWYPVDENQLTWATAYYFTGNFTWTVCLPDDYDGLCLALYVKGYDEVDFSEIEDIDNEEVEHLLDPDKETGEETMPEDYVIIRVKDIVSLFADGEV